MSNEVEVCTFWDFAGNTRKLVVWRVQENEIPEYILDRYWADGEDGYRYEMPFRAEVRDEDGLSRAFLHLYPSAAHAVRNEMPWNMVEAWGGVGLVVLNQDIYDAALELIEEEKKGRERELERKRELDRISAEEHFAFIDRFDAAVKMVKGKRGNFFIAQSDGGKKLVVDGYLVQEVERPNAEPVFAYHKDGDTWTLTQLGTGWSLIRYLRTANHAKGIVGLMLQEHISWSGIQDPDSVPDVLKERTMAVIQDFKKHIARR